MVAVDSVIVDTIDIWPGECKTVNGKPRSPWVLGSVEQGNSNKWTTWLPEIQC